MSKPVITIYDIARALGISPSTVSRALKDDSIISSETRKKVKKTAEEMGYQPNSIASSLRNKKTLTIGVITHRIDRNFQSRAISGIQDKAHEHGYNIIICQTNDDPDREVKQFQALFSSRIDGLIGQLSMYTRNYDHFQLFLENDIPIVLFDRVPRNLDVQKVVSDDVGGGYKATEHLILQGNKRIAFFTGALSLNIYEDRLKGYKDALEKYGIPFDPDLVFEFYLNTENSRKAARALLADKKKRPDSIFAANDTSAIATIQVAKELGIEIPAELAIVGYANDPSGLIVSPTLSTIDQSAYRMGQIATQLLLKQIEEKKPGKNTSLETTILPVELIVRESSVRK
ncbi:LacI family transcriptional regulator [Anseongella ginsenosidimutans]|uniref:LacI family transcriptional regulator n=1 Tax=Anseongella ginsenosidimutans TaxID=496056 RepID=A0A4R3KY04_9SPHI|nr:LacI family DNA-binding transcriptional regulator [Anseongella ginsenosidimutans]QEC51409.1 LacI family transcriptional regulator [Anseongella ginsenosidimutans]TCS89886.1 LacI family transcriptional regulator [Anseongella ginsenosidimutans]